MKRFSKTKLTLVSNKKCEENKMGNVRMKGPVAGKTRVARQAGNWKNVVSPAIQKLGERISQTEGAASERELKQQ